MVPVLVPGPSTTEIYYPFERKWRKINAKRKGREKLKTDKPCSSKPHQRPAPLVVSSS
jgi:hypothetical protein